MSSPITTVKLMAVRKDVLREAVREQRSVSATIRILLREALDRRKRNHARRRKS